MRGNSRIKKNKITCREEVRAEGRARAENQGKHQQLRISNRIRKLKESLCREDLLLQGKLKLRDLTPERESFAAAPKSNKKSKGRDD